MIKKESIELGICNYGSFGIPREVFQTFQKIKKKNIIRVQFLKIKLTVLFPFTWKTRE